MTLNNEFDENESELDPKSEKELDDMYYASQQDFLRKRLREQRKKKQDRILKRQKIIHEVQQFLKKIPGSTIRSIGKIGTKLLDPQFIVTLFALFTFQRELNKINNEIAVQKSEIQTVRQQQQQPYKIKEVWDNNWPKIIVGGGSILFSVGKQAYSHYQTKSELAQTRGKLTEAKSQLNETQNELTEAKKDKIRIKEDYKKHISKLHTTLNRFNDAALASAKRENEMRNEIKQCKNQLGELIEQRDLIKEELFNIEKINESKNHELAEASLEIKVLKNKIQAKETDQAQLEVEFERLNQEKRWWNRRVTQVKKELNIADEERKRLYNQLSSKTKENNRLKKDKENLEKNIENQKKYIDNTQQTITKLKDDNHKNEIALQKAVDKTDRFALRMDEAENKIKSYKQNANKFADQNEELKQEIKNKEYDILIKDQKNQQLEENIQTTKDQLYENIIQKDLLQKQIVEDKNSLAKASKKEKVQIQRLISKHKKDIEARNKINQKLKTRIKKDGKLLAKGEINQELLKDELNNYQNQLKKKHQKVESYYSRLQTEREEQQQKFNSALETSNQLVNQLLNKQEQDQARSWWQKIPIKIRPSLNLNNQTKKEKTEKIHERESYFFPSLFTLDQSIPQKVYERYSEEKQEWEIIPEKTNPKNPFNKKDRNKTT